MKKKRFNSGLTGALAGGAAGAQIGTAINPGYGTAIGGVAGAGLGFLAGINDADANAPYDKLNMDEQSLSNDLLRQKLEDSRRANRAARVNDRSMELFRNYLGAAFKGSRPTSFAQGMKAYPGLGNQAVS